MPRLDRTGPWGMGPMTGGARGRCNPYGRGLRCYGRGRGFGGSLRPDYAGRGLARGFGGTADLTRRAGPEDELAALRDESAALKGELDALAKRIRELEGQQST